jgi:hypothetical protein
VVAENTHPFYIRFFSAGMQRVSIEKAVAIPPEPAPKVKVST